MASNGKKGKKKKATTISIQEFLGPKADDLVIKKTSWADEMEQQGNDLDEDPSSRIVINRSALPTAPRSALGANIDMSRVPKEKPFKAFLANLPFEVTNDDIRRFFKDLSIVNIHLLSDSSGRLKGSGYAEFETREMLIEALNYAESMMKGRSIRVDLADQHDRSDRDRPDGGFRSRDRDRDDGDDKTLGDWRKKDESSSDRFSGRERRDDVRDRYSSDRFEDRGGEPRRGWSGAGSRDGDRYNFNSRPDRGYHDERDRDRDFSRSSFGSSFRNRDQYPADGDRFGGRDSGSHRRSEDRFRSEDGFRNDDQNRNRYESDRFRNSERRDGRFHDGDRYRDGDRNERYRGDDRSDGRYGARYRDDDREYSDKNRDRRRSNERGLSHDEDEERGHERWPQRGRDDDREVVSSRSRDVSAEKARPKGRPKLNLQPRTKPLEEAGQMASSSASIFGGAKPVDTTQKLREIEEKHSSTLRRKQEKENRIDHEEDLHPSRGSRHASSERPASEENSVYKRQDSASSKNRQKRDVAQDESGSGRRKDRHSSTSSGHGSTSGRKPSNTEVEEPSNIETAEVATEKPSSPPVRMIPAPPPKENVWEKRKTAQQHQATVPPTTPGVEDASNADGDQKDFVNDEPESLAVETAPVSSVSDLTSIPDDSSNPVTTTEGETDAPVVNVWEARRKETDIKSQKAERPLEISSHDGEPRKRAVVSVAGVRDAGGRGSLGSEHNDRRPVGPRGGGRGGTGAWRSEGSNTRRSDSDGKRTGSKKDKEKPLPASVDEMPKLEDKSNKDWSDKNKFSSLLLDEDNGSDVESKDSECDDN